MAALQGFAWLSGHQQDVMTVVATWLTAITTAGSWILSQAQVIQSLLGKSAKIIEDTKAPH